MSAPEQAATAERFAQDPYVARVVDLCQRRTLFDQEESVLARLRSELLQQSVAFFARSHPRFYATRFERLGITSESATVMDLPRLAVMAEQLRGEGQRTFIIPGIPPGGATFQSSGTTSGSPVTIYRSPLDLFVQRFANGLFWEYMLGNDATGGTCLFMASPELRTRLAFVEFVSEFME